MLATSVAGIAIPAAAPRLQAAAARFGAPLGHVFCAISLSDNLKPWTLIEKRLEHAARGDFVITLYNPASKARPTRIVDAFTLLRGLLSGDRFVGLAKSIAPMIEDVVSTTSAPFHRTGDVVRS